MSAALMTQPHAAMRGASVNHDLSGRAEFFVLALQRRYALKRCQHYHCASRYREVVVLLPRAAAFAHVILTGTESVLFNDDWARADLPDEWGYAARGRMHSASASTDLEGMRNPEGTTAPCQPSWLGQTGVRIGTQGLTEAARVALKMVKYRYKECATVWWRRLLKHHRPRHIGHRVICGLQSS